MSKRLYTYAGFTAQDLKSRASIPSQADIVVGSNYIDCSSVDIPSEIRDIIGEGSNDLGTIYLSAKVNKWSGFGPREWYVSGGLLLNRPKSNPYDMANFCGYNHNAVAPGFMSSGESNKPTTFDYNTNQSSVLLSAALQGGEINFPGMVGATHVKWVIKEGANTKGSTNTAIGSYYNTFPIIPTVTINIDSSGNKTYTSNLYLSNAAGDELCLYPNTTQWTISARQQLPATVAISCIAPLGYSEGTASLDISFQQYTINLGVVHKGNAYGFAAYNGRINMTVKVYNKQGVLAHTQVITTADSARNFTGTINGYDVVYDNSVVFEVSNSDPL